MKKVAIIMGSDSDLPVVSKAAEFAASARKNGFGVIIAPMGMAVWNEEAGCERSIHTATMT